MASLWIRIINSFCLLLAVTACAPAASSEWEGINYAEIACGKASAGCKHSTDDESISSIGRGKR